MNSWRIHFGWAIVTVLTAIVAVRVAARKEPEQVRQPVPARSTPVVEATKPPGLPAPVDLAAAPASTPATPVVDEDRIRALLLSQTDFEKLKKIFDEIPDRALKLKLLREAACSKDVRNVYSALTI